MTEDSPEAIQFCLNCTRPAYACNSCGGPMKRKRLHRGGRKAAPREVVETALAMADAGIPHKVIAEKLGVAKATISMWKWKRQQEVNNYECE